MLDAAQHVGDTHMCPGGVNTLDPAMAQTKPTPVSPGQILSPGHPKNATHPTPAGANTLLGAILSAQPTRTTPRDFDPGHDNRAPRRLTAGVNSLAADQPTDEAHAHNRSGNTLTPVTPVTPVHIPRVAQWHPDRDTFAPPIPASQPNGPAAAQDLTPGHQPHEAQRTHAGEATSNTQQKGSK